VLELPTADGKLTAQQVEENYLVYLNDPKREHWVQPKMVYISHPSEVGTLYTKKELEELSVTCKKYGLYLFLDGARLGYGLMSPGTDLTLKDIARLCDVFYIGGTKCGALFGEAAVILNPDLKPDFHTIMKQSGAVLAKGRLLGLQFQTLFTDNLYEKICQHGINMAMLLKEAFAEKGLPFVAESFTNQQFPILTEKMYETLTKKYGIGSWEVFDNGTRAVRFCTSWATSEEQVHNLINDLKAL
jgi:threonine aldolase